MDNAPTSEHRPTGTVEANRTGSLPEQPVPYVVHLVIPRKSPQCVLGEVLPDRRLRLPRTKLPGRLDSLEPHRMHEIDVHIEAELGIRGYTVRDIWNGRDTQIRGAEGAEEHEIMLMDAPEDQLCLNRRLEWIPRDIAISGKWMPTNADEDGTNVNARLEGIFDEIDGKPFAIENEPWRSIGWIEKLTSWTRQMLDGRNMVIVGRMRRRHVSRHSSVMSLEVRNGRDRDAGKKEAPEVMFIKSYFRTMREAERTNVARAVLGDIVPEVMDFDKSEGIMIQRSAGVVTDVPWDQEALINTILKMQVLSMNRISELEAGGLLVADSEWVESHVEWILKHTLFDDRVYYETDNEAEGRKMMEKLRAKIGVMRGECRKITKLGLPRTIAHGDMCPLNVGGRLKEGEQLYRFFDWEKSFIGSPLHDFSTLLSGGSDDFPDYSVNCEAGLRQVYEHWKPCTSLKEMKYVFRVISMMQSFIQMYRCLEQFEAVDDSEYIIQCDSVWELRAEIGGLYALTNEIFGDPTHKEG